MCVKAVDTCPFVFDSVPNQYKTQEMCNKVVSKNPFMLKYCLDRYEIEEMLDKVADAFLPTLKVFLNWLVTSKMIKTWRGFIF